MVKHNQVPYMNSRLRKAINVRNMLRRKFVRNRQQLGCDNIPPKILKTGAYVLSRPIKFLINQSVDANTFPGALKLADAVPVYKKEDALDMKKNRPVNVLPCLYQSDLKVFYLNRLVYFLKACYRSICQVLEKGIVAKVSCLI